MKRSDRIAHVIITSQLLLNYLSDSLAENVFGMQVKMKAKNLQQELIRVEKKHFDHIAGHEAAEDPLYNMYALMNNYAHTLCNLHISDLENVQAMIEAYRKDPKSMSGIVNKILKK